MASKIIQRQFGSKTIFSLYTRKINPVVETSRCKIIANRTEARCDVKHAAI